MAGSVPPPIPRPATLSLVNAALTPDQAASVDGVGTRWELGYRFQPEACTGAWVEDPCNVEPRVIEDRPAIVEVEPFQVVAGDRCSSFGFLAEDYQGRAQRLLQRQQSNQIAHELWTGELAATAGWPNPSLVGSGVPAEGPDVLTNGPSSVIAALACLEQYLAVCGGGARGMIHATPQLVTQWAALGNSVLRREGGQLLTIHDTIVVSDGGYDGSGPGNVPASNSQWAYATGLVTVEMAPIEVVPDNINQALDRATNTIEFFAQRAATASWDTCCHGAAEVDLAVCLVGGAS